MAVPRVEVAQDRLWELGGTALRSEKAVDPGI